MQPASDGQHLCQPKRPRRIYHPQVEFATRDGRLHKFTGSMGSKPASLKTAITLGSCTIRRSLNMPASTRFYQQYGVPMICMVMACRLHWPGRLENGKNSWESHGIYGIVSLFQAPCCWPGHYSTDSTRGMSNARLATRKERYCGPSQRQGWQRFFGEIEFFTPDGGNHTFPVQISNDNNRFRPGRSVPSSMILVIWTCQC